MNKLIPLTLLAALQLIAINSSAHEAHVHGSATVLLAQDGNRLTLEFDSPLDNLLGFEHAPRTDKQKQAAKALLDLIQKPDTLLKLNAEADCQLAKVKVVAPVLQTTATDKDEHANLHAEYEYACTKVAVLKSLQLSLFDAFPAIHKVDAQVAGARGQVAATLTPKQRMLVW